MSGRNVFYYQTHLKAYTQENRRNPTPEEKLLWYEFLRKHTYQFRRQKSFGCYIVDFYCSKAKLVVELDDGQHFTEEGKVWDENRTAYLNSLCLRVIRFTNAQVNREFDAVCQAINTAIEEALSST